MKIKNKIIIEHNEKKSLISLTKEIHNQYKSIDNPKLTQDLPHLIGTLPIKLRNSLWGFREEKGFPYIIISGLDPKYFKIENTPLHWNTVSNNSLQETLLFLLASSMGDVYSYKGMQAGKLIQDIIPIKGNEKLQLGSGSVELYLHTEDGFHPNRPDFIGLFCNRNKDKTPTTISIPDLNKLTQIEKEILSRQNFRIYSDQAHSKVDQIRNQESVDGILIGPTNDPYLRFDPIYTDLKENSFEEKQAVKKLKQISEDAIVEIALNPGEILFLDNYRCLHGRKYYLPKFDGTDRWLKRLFITKDIRRSSHLWSDNNLRVLKCL